MLDDNKRRIHGFEVEAVREAVREKLTKLVKDRQDLETAQTLLRVLYRFESNQVGNPAYPLMGTFSEIATWLGVNSPRDEESS